MISDRWSLDLSERPEGDGLAPEDLPALRRELFAGSLAVARREHSPSAEWEAFVEAAWEEVRLAFGFLEREPWPGGLERPGLGDAERADPQSDGDSAR